MTQKWVHEGSKFQIAKNRWLNERAEPVSTAIFIKACNVTINIDVFVFYIRWFDHSLSAFQDTPIVVLVDSEKKLISITIFVLFCGF